jgi:surface protein
VCAAPSQLAACEILGMPSKPQTACTRQTAARADWHATMMGRLALLCVVSLLEAVAGSYVMTDSNIYTAVDAWFDDRSGAEATYGHISSWDTSGVTDMTQLFCAATWGFCHTAAASFNEDISAWDTSGVTDMGGMFYSASAFDQDLGWCVGNAVFLGSAFEDTQCESTSCGVTQVADVADCPTPAPTTPAPTPAPTTPRPTPAPTPGALGSDSAKARSATLCLVTIFLGAAFS